MSNQVDGERPAPHRFVLKDPLLRRLLLLNEPTPAGKPLIESWSVGKMLGAALLTWFVQQALGVRRLPFFEDRLLSSVSRYKSADILAVLEELNPARVDAIVDEVRSLYAHTQAQLKAKGVGVVHLRRHIDERRPDGDEWHLRGSGPHQRGQAGEFAMLRLAADALSQKTVDIDMDTLNSWGDDGHYGHRAVHLHCSVPAADILFATELIDGAESKLESGEWVVINRSLTGVVTIPTSSLEVQDLALDKEQYRRVFHHQKPEQVLARYQPLVFRPSVNLGGDPSPGRPAFFSSWSYRLGQAWRLLRTGHA